MVHHHAPRAVSERKERNREGERQRSGERQREREREIEHETVGITNLVVLKAKVLCMLTQLAHL